MGPCSSTSNKPQHNRVQNSNGISSQHMTPNQPQMQPLAVNKGEVYFSRKGNVSGEINWSEAQKVEMFLTLKNVTNASINYKVRVSLFNSKQKNPTPPLGDTELNSGSEIAFAVTFVVDYYFEREQTLILQLYDDLSNLLSTVQTTLGNIMGSRGMCKSFPCINKEGNPLGEIFVDCKNAVKTKKRLTLNFTSKLERSDVYMMINNNNDGKTWRPVYKSQEYFNATYVEYKPITLKSELLYGGDDTRPVLIEFFRCNGNTKIGQVMFNFNQLRQHPSSTFPIEESNGVYHNQNLQAKEIGELTISFSEDEGMSFIDHLKNGMQVSLIVGIDFTSSNGNPNNSDSLHYMHGQYPNTYYRSIQSCGSTIAYYDYDQKFPVLGFGGRRPTDQRVSHCFNLNLQDNPECLGVEGILNTYRNSLNTIALSAPTLFAPLIRSVIEIVKSKANSPDEVYYILMILTDGIINDMDDTIDALVECDALPLSVIIIGIGDSDFSNMVILDGDGEKLKDSRGRRSRRDLVQFVEFRRFEGDEVKLAEEVLHEVPKQVEDYYDLKR